MRQVKCSQCGHVGKEDEFPKGRDFFQKAYICGCPKCDNRQSPGEASMRMFGDQRPFVFVEVSPPTETDAVSQVLRQSNEAS